MENNSSFETALTSLISIVQIAKEHKNKIQTRKVLIEKYSIHLQIKQINDEFDKMIQRILNLTNN